LVAVEAVPTVVQACPVQEALAAAPLVEYQLLLLVLPTKDMREEQLLVLEDG
jgi:hypothetical protein